MENVLTYLTLHERGPKCTQKYLPSELQGLIWGHLYHKKKPMNYNQSRLYSIPTNDSIWNRGVTCPVEELLSKGYRETTDAPIILMVHGPPTTAPYRAYLERFRTKPVAAWWDVLLCAPAHSRDLSAANVPPIRATGGMVYLHQHLTLDDPYWSSSDRGRRVVWLKVIRHRMVISVPRLDALVLIKSGFSNTKTCVFLNYYFIPHETFGAHRLKV